MYMLKVAFQEYTDDGPLFVVSQGAKMHLNRKWTDTCA